jgi:hypothetical protein
MKSRSLAWPIFYVMAGGALTIISELAIAPLVLESIDNGGSLWLVWLLAVPLLFLPICCALAARAESAGQAHSLPSGPPELRVVDYPLPDELSPTELEMLRRNDSRFGQHVDDAMGLLVTPWPVNAGLVRPRGGDQ